MTRERSFPTTDTGARETRETVEGGRERERESEREREMWRRGSPYVVSGEASVLGEVDEE